MAKRKTTQIQLVKKIVRLKTQIEKLHDNLRRSQAIIKAVFEHSPVGITVRLGSGELVSFNKAWKKIWNLTYHKIAENERKCKNWNVRQRYPFLKDAIPKVQRIFDKGGEIFLPEIHVTSPDTKFDKWISQHYYAIKDIHGRVEHI
ncbi:MAG: hypothetical protein ABIL22_06855, partial [candidate division WOR-3 bacterium]